MPLRRFELTEGTTAKFWEINQRGKRAKVCFGRIGTNGQTREKEYASTSAAKAATDSLISQKMKKGYQEMTKTSQANARTKTSRNAGGPKTVSQQTQVVSAASIPKKETLSFVGLVNPSDGGGGVRNGRARKWDFHATLAAWRVDGGPVVRENIELTVHKIGDRKLSSLMEQFLKWKLVRFTAQRSKRQTRPDTMVDLVEYLGETRDKELLKVKQELSLPVEFRDRTFGTIRYDREMEFFEGELSHRGEKLFVWFETESVEEAKTMVRLAKPLWRSRVKWFKEFQAFALERFLELSRNWQFDEKAEPLTSAEFLRLLGNPCGLKFRLVDGELEYIMSAYCEELFGSHSIEIEGTPTRGMIEGALE